MAVQRVPLGILALSLLLCGVACWSPPAGPLKWWQTGVVYQVYPRSYQDSGNDGVGDLQGITSRLEYLSSDLEVSAVWLSPIYPSPQADFGYDISNFTDVDPQYGTLKDFDYLVATAHRLGLKVVLDFVPNHSSDEHPWFNKSADPSHPEHAKYRDYYVWADPKGMQDNKPIPPNNWLSVFRGSAWTYSPQRKQYYLHQFLKKQPDLNFRNPQVMEEIKNAIRFWIRRKVDGFRIDAAPHLFEDAQLRDEARSGNTQDSEDHAYLIHNYTTNLPETYDLIQQWRAVIDEFKDADRVMMVEAYASMEETIKYYGTPEKPGANFPFNFLLIMDLNQASNATDFKNVIDRWMENMTPGRWPNWVIGNHDQKRVATRFGPQLADAMNMISLSLPGTAMTYYGEEIAMSDTFIRWEDTLDPQAINKGKQGYLAVSRDPCRTPFQWDNTKSAGFSQNVSTWLPVNPNYWTLNYENQQKASLSSLKVYQTMIGARLMPAFQRGDIKTSVKGTILQIDRTLAHYENLTLIVNLGTREANWTIPDLNKWSILTSSVNSEIETGEKSGCPVSVVRTGSETLVYHNSRSLHWIYVSSLIWWPTSSKTMFSE